jgi:hypothetical protein
VVKSCLQIRHFDLCLCTSLSNKTLETLSNYDPLRILDVAGCNKMTFKGLMAFAAKKKKSSSSSANGLSAGGTMKRLSFGGLKDVTEESFNILKPFLPDAELSVLPQRAVPLDLRFMRHRRVGTGSIDNHIGDGRIASAAALKESSVKYLRVDEDGLILG